MTAARIRFGEDHAAEGRLFSNVMFKSTSEGNCCGNGNAGQGGARAAIIRRARPTTNSCHHFSREDMPLRPFFHGHEESAFAEMSLPLEVLHTRIIVEISLFYSQPILSESPTCVAKYVCRTQPQCVLARYDAMIFRSIPTFAGQTPVRDQREVPLIFSGCARFPRRHSDVRRLRLSPPSRPG